MTEEFRNAFAEALCRRTVVSPEDMMIYLEARGDGIRTDEFLELCRQFGMGAGEIIDEVREKLAKKPPVDKVEWLRSLINADFGDDTVVEVTYQYTVNRNIAAIIKANGLSQRDVARRAGFTEAVFSNIVNNRRKVYADEVYGIASALGVSIEELFVGR